MHGNYVILQRMVAVGIVPMVVVNLYKSEIVQHPMVSLVCNRFIVNTPSAKVLYFYNGPFAKCFCQLVIASHSYVNHCENRKVTLAGLFLMDLPRCFDP